MTSLLVLVPDTGQVLLQKNIGGSAVPSVTYLPLGATFCYGQKFDIKLEKFVSEHQTIMYQQVTDCILIIVVQRRDQVPVDEEEQLYLNSLVADFSAALVFLKGKSDLESPAFSTVDINAHIGRLQRELQMFSSFFDVLIRNGDSFGTLLGSIDTLLPECKSELTEHLEAFTEACECVYACILVDGKLVTATSDFLTQLKVIEMRLIVYFASAAMGESQSSIADVPIFLPFANPTNPVRLVRIQLIYGVTLCMLCADDVKLPLVISQIEQRLSPEVDLLHSCCHLKERCFPLQLQPNDHVQAFCCLNKTSRLCLSSFDVHVKPTIKMLEKGDMRRYLIQFIKSNYELIKHLDSPRVPVPSQDLPVGDMSPPVHSTGYLDEPSELYWVKKDCKVYLLGVSNYILVTLFSSETPTYPMRSISTALLDSIKSLSNF